MSPSSVTVVTAIGIEIVGCAEELHRLALRPSTAPQASSLHDRRADPDPDDAAEEGERERLQDERAR